MLFYEPTDCWIKGINKKIMQNMWNMCFYILYVNESVFNITCRKCNKFFGHLLCYRSTLAGLRRCLQGNPGASWLFSFIDPCEFDMCLINWRMVSSANCFYFSNVTNVTTILNFRAYLLYTRQTIL